MASLNGLMKLLFFIVELTLVIEPFTPPKPLAVAGTDVLTPLVDAIVFFVRLCDCAKPAFWGETLAKSDVFSVLRPSIPTPAEIIESFGFTIALLALVSKSLFAFRYIVINLIGDLLKSRGGETGSSALTRMRS